MDANTENFAGIREREDREPLHKYPDLEPDFNGQKPPVYYSVPPLLRQAGMGLTRISYFADEQGYRKSENARPALRQDRLLILHQNIDLLVGHLVLALGVRIR